MLPFSAGKTIWDELPETNVDVEKLEHLFESRAKDLISKVRNFGTFLSRDDDYVTFGFFGFLLRFFTMKFFLLF